MFNIAVYACLVRKWKGRSNASVYTEFTYRPPNCWLICVTIWIEVAISHAGLNDHIQLCSEKFCYTELTDKRLSAFRIEKPPYLSK